MAGASKDLLYCNDQPPKPSIIEGLFSSKKETSPKTLGSKNQSDATGGRPFTTTVPTSDVLGKVKDFLGVMAKANEKLKLDAQGSSPSKYDIEVLDGNKEECIEMDLLLGVADLQNPEALAAAEATMGSFQPFPNNSIYDTGDSSEDDDSGEDDNRDDDHEDKSENPDSDDPDDSKRKPNKRPKIVVLD